VASYELCRKPRSAVGMCGHDIGSASRKTCGTSVGRDMNVQGLDIRKLLPFVNIPDFRKESQYAMRGLDSLFDLRQPSQHVKMPVKMCAHRNSASTAPLFLPQPSHIPREHVLFHHFPSQINIPSEHWNLQQPSSFPPKPYPYKFKTLICQPWKATSEEGH
jgi:hypothetical protein